MNIFKKGDLIHVSSHPQLGAVKVKYINGPYVYYEHPTYNQANAHYNSCSLFEPKFKPGDVVSNGLGEHTIKCLKTDYGNGVFSGQKYEGPIAYDYANGGWDRENSLTLVKSSPTIAELINAGKKIEAIKLHRIINGTGLKEAKDAVEAIAATLPVEAAAAATKFKVGDKVATHSEPDDVGVVVSIRGDRYAINFASYGTDDYCPTYIWRDDELSLVTETKPAKFKVGDVVKHNYRATIYVVKDVRPYDGFLFFEGYGDGYHNPYYFTLTVSPTPTIVVRKRNGSYQPNTNPRIHDTQALAQKEAERLAVANPGVEFATFVLASTSTATPPVAGKVTTVAA